MKGEGQTYTNGHQIRDMYLKMNLDPLFDNGTEVPKHEGLGMALYRHPTNEENAGEGAYYGSCFKDEKQRLCESALPVST